MASFISAPVSAIAVAVEARIAYQNIAEALQLEDVLIAVARKEIGQDSLMMLQEFCDDLGIYPYFRQMLDKVEGDLALMIRKGLHSPNMGINAYWPTQQMHGTRHIYVVSDSTLNLGKKSSDRAAVHEGPYTSYFRCCYGSKGF